MEFGPVTPDEADDSLVWQYWHLERNKKCPILTVNDHWNLRIYAGGICPRLYAIWHILRIKTIEFVWMVIRQTQILNQYWLERKPIHKNYSSERKWFIVWLIPVKFNIESNHNFGSLLCYYANNSQFIVKNKYRIWDLLGRFWLAELRETISCWSKNIKENNWNVQQWGSTRNRGTSCNKYDHPILNQLRLKG